LKFLGLNSALRDNKTQNGAIEAVNKIKDSATPSTPRQILISSAESHSKVSTKQRRPDPTEKKKNKSHA
jgi:hypothetical protein